MRTKMFIAVCVMSGLTISAHATVINHGTYTTDTTSGLDWLDTSFTANQSYDQVTTELAGGSLNGWRYATADDLFTLISNFTGTPSTKPTASFTFGALAQLIAYLGPTYTNPDLTVLDGIIDEEFQPGMHFAAQMFTSSEYKIDVATSNSLLANDNEAYPSSLLV